MKFHVSCLYFPINYFNNCYDKLSYISEFHLVCNINKLASGSINRQWYVVWIMYNFTSDFGYIHWNSREYIYSLHYQWICTSIFQCTKSLDVYIHSYSNIYTQSLMGEVALNTFSEVWENLSIHVMTKMTSVKIRNRK